MGKSKEKMGRRKEKGRQKWKQKIILKQIVREAFWIGHGNFYGPLCESYLLFSANPVQCEPWL